MDSLESPLQRRMGCARRNAEIAKPLGDGQPTLCEGNATVGNQAQEGVHDGRVIGRPTATSDLAKRRVGAARGTIGPVRRHRLEYICYSDDAGADRNLIATETAWIPAAVEAFVMLQDHVSHGPRKRDSRDDVVVDLRVILDQLEFGWAQRARLVENL